MEKGFDDRPAVVSYQVMGFCFIVSHAQNHGNDTM
jgi:hypothetical protein